MKTETLKEQFNKLHFPIDEETGWDFIKDIVVPAVVSDMLVEERCGAKEDSYSFYREMGFNQCCTLQKENEKKLKQELCKTSKS